METIPDTQAPLQKYMKQEKWSRMCPLIHRNSSVMDSNTSELHEILDKEFRRIIVKLCIKMKEDKLLN